MADCGLTETGGTNPRSEMQNPESSDEAAVASHGAEDDAVQGQTVPFEEDVAPPALAEETMQEEPVECAPHAVLTDQNEADTGQAPEAGTAGNPQSEIPNPQSELPTIESVIEAILFATDEPRTDSRLADIVETTTKQVRESIKSLNARYEAHNSAFRIEQIAGGYQMLTMSVYNNWLKKMLRARSDSRLSPAAMETLAIIAYKQPITRAGIEAVRGVNSDAPVATLLARELIEEVGRAGSPGRPALFGVTVRFLEHFGLERSEDLPPLPEEGGEETEP